MSFFFRPLCVSWTLTLHLLCCRLLLETLHLVLLIPRKKFLTFFIYLHFRLAIQAGDGLPPTVIYFRNISVRNIRKIKSPLFVFNGNFFEQNFRYNLYIQYGLRSVKICTFFYQIRPLYCDCCLKILFIFLLRLVKRNKFENHICCVKRLYTFHVYYNNCKKWLSQEIWSYTIVIIGNQRDANTRFFSKKLFSPLQYFIPQYITVLMLMYLLKKLLTYMTHHA